jgi:hypothetical protein
MKIEQVLRQNQDEINVSLHRPFVNLQSNYPSSVQLYENDVIE